MYVTIQAQDGFKLPCDCYLELQVGGSQQFAKFDQQCKFTLPSLLLGSSVQRGTIDIYQKVGTCDFSFQATGNENLTCNVTAEAPSMEGLRLRVDTEPQESPRQNSGLFDFCSASSFCTTDKINLLVNHSAITQGFKDISRMLVFTDVGEEVDDEAALWLCRQHLKSTPHVEVDVVFVTGYPLQRATRWAQILNSAGESLPKVRQINYYTGPQSDRHMRYRTFADVDELRAAGLDTFLSRPFEGGYYDVVLQLSPVWGFSSNFASPQAGTAGALAHIRPRPGSNCLLQIVVGGVGSTNFPRDDLHFGLQKALNEKGFRTVHVEKSNYLNWDKGMFETFPPKLVEIVLDDEWNKAVGRIPPFAANLLVRFRVNTNVNYDVVDRAYAAFEQDLRGTPSLVKAKQWWSEVRDEVEAKILHGYVKLSRDRDNKSSDVFGNHMVSEKIKGMKFSWESLMSRTCLLDVGAVLALQDGANLRRTVRADSAISLQMVDDILHLAVCEMTGKLLKIYAYNRYISGREPDMAQLAPYLDGTQDKAPLDFHTFPELHGDISSIQKEVVGNPMYDPAGMLVALIALGSNAQQIAEMSSKLDQKMALMDDQSRVAAMKAVYLGETQEQLVMRYADKSDVGKKRSTSNSATRMLVLTDVGDDADGEAALWLLSTYLAQMTDVDVDVVFTTGSPALRAMRWASVLNNAGLQNVQGQKSMHYFVGVESCAEMKYFIKLDENELNRAGMRDLSESFFDGGAYNIIIQASPIEGFSGNFTDPPSGPEGALARLSAAPGKSGRPMYIVVGDEGTTNFPRDDLHRSFRDFLVKQGFSPVHANQKSYAHWGLDLLLYLPPTLVKLVLQDEWRKAVGRVPPSKASLFARFRVNTYDNYEVLDAAYRSFVHTNKTDTNFQKALAWWSRFSGEVKQCVIDSYITASRESDNMGTVFGNPAIKCQISGRQSTWRSTMSDSCVRDILASTQMTENQLLALTVDEVMSLAVTQITGKLLQIYAFHCFDAKMTPSKTLCLAYVSGSSENPPLDFYQFPRLFGDLSTVKKQVVGNPMYDTSAALLALCLMTGTTEQCRLLTEKVTSQTPWLTPAERTSILCAAFRGESLPNIIDKMCCLQETTMTVNF
eukprot:TRINITY_DN24213_c0_g2_i1.p1 TRINITY_DN24213_c0_g2~~TRINITY_DN24213_c0_g2_i1.p1  ORF type:complete len:1119 (+),score=142.49 TRINITY_DN24213_c0_g2_i1:101-3457(+)